MEEIKVYFAEIGKNGRDADAVFEGYSKRAVVRGEEDDYQSFMETNTHISVMKDGALVLSDEQGESFIYFYPEQLIHLERALDIAIDIAMKRDIGKVFGEYIENNKTK